MVDVDEVGQELGECRKVLEQQPGHAVRCLTYPVGKFEPFGHAGPLVAKKVGFAWTLTAVEKVALQRETAIFFPDLRRTCISPG